MTLKIEEACSLEVTFKEQLASEMLKERMKIAWIKNLWNKRSEF